MHEIVISSAQIVFIAATTLITISSVVLSSAWKTLRSMVSSLPIDRQRVRFNIESIKDEREKDKASIIMFQFMGCMCFIASIALSIFAIIGVASVMLGYNIGFYQQQNYQFGNDCLYIGIIFFTIGFLILGFTYIDRIRAITKGEPEIATTDLANLPIMPPAAIAQRRRRDRLLMILVIVCIFVMLVIQVINPAGTWTNVLLSLAALALIVGLTFATMKIKNRIKK